MTQREILEDLLEVLRLEYFAYVRKLGLVVGTGPKNCAVNWKFAPTQAQVDEFAAYDKTVTARRERIEEQLRALD